MPNDSFVESLTKISNFSEFMKYILTILFMMFTFSQQNSPSTLPEPNIYEITQEHLKDKLIYHVNQEINNEDISRHIVEAGLEHNINICFMMAQSLTETNYGTTGAGKSRYSLFGVSSRYKSYKEAIYDYCRLLTQNYLVNGKTEEHLMRNYVNKNGHRYAQSKTYEIHLTKNYRNIVESTNILELQNEYTKTTNSTYVAVL